MLSTTPDASMLAEQIKTAARTAQVNNVFYTVPSYIFIWWESGVSLDCKNAAPRYSTAYFTVYSLAGDQQC